MARESPPHPTRGAAPWLVILALLLLPGSSLALLGPDDPRFLGAYPWEPELIRARTVFASLASRPMVARLSGAERKIREQVEIDLETGTIRVVRLYGKTPLGPAWSGELRRTFFLAARRGAEDIWREKVSLQSLEPARRADAGLVTIDIPVEFPDALADVIGQGARLNLTGSEQITFSGTSRIIDGGPTYESLDRSAFPDLDMEQKLRVNLDGTIGEKIHVLLNHDSEINTEFENKIQLRYDGDEDEVVQKIEMGNTDLVLPGAEFLSFRKSQQGLFGAKALAKFGPLDFTVIASKQEGETARQTFVGQARRDSLVIKDVDFVSRKYYWIADPLVLGERLPIQDFELFLDDKEVNNNIADGAVLSFAHADFLAVTDSSGFHRGYFHRLTENVDYQIDRQTGALELERSVYYDQALAMLYTFSVGDSTITVGDTSIPDTLSLQILAPPETELYDDAKGFADIRRLERKNVYSLGARNIVPESLELVIRRRASSAGQQDEDIQINDADPTQNLEYVRILGLDYKGLNDAEPDLKVEPEFIDFEDGTVTFPNITPFAPDSSIYVVNGDTVSINVIVSPTQVATGRSEGVRPSTEKEGVALLDPNGAVYVKDSRDRYRAENHKYYMEAKYTTPTPTYNLNRFNILEGSERVRLNGRQLNRGTDYDIEYDFGILTFRTPEASLPDAEIEVDFEYVPLFGQAKESLVGVSGTYNFSPQTRLSSSWLFFSKASPEERPKLGQEPSRTLVGNMYGQWVENPEFMTKLVNALPLVRSEAESEFQLQGEVAVSLPNPNTKNEIYIDDMEGVEDSRDLGITRGLWVPASEPIGPEGVDAFFNKSPSSPTGGPVPQLPFNWYNPENVARREDVFPELAEEKEGSDFIQVLEFAVRDRTAEDQANPDSAGWFGIMRNLSPTGEDFSEKKFLEIWINDYGRREGTVIFDIGEISEDFYLRPSELSTQKGRDYLDTEDIDPFDGQLTVSREDFGLDNVKGDDGGSVAGDDGDDDFQFQRTANPDYTRINNMERNSLLDTEDLDDDNLLDTDNAYLSYVIDLAEDSEYEKQDNNDVVPGNPWRLFQIPLDDGIVVGGIPRRKTIKYARLWLDGLPEALGPKIQIASIKIVGAAWREERISTNDTVEPVPEGQEAGSFFISTINNKEDLAYQPPFDPGDDPNTREERREQSLVVNYDEIPSAGTGTSYEGGLQGSAFKEILDVGQGVSQDYTQYERLTFYMRDGRSARGDPDRSQGTFFFRFGPDTTNFYEFSAPLGPKWEGWREVSLRLNDLAELKLDPAETTRTVEGAQVDYRNVVSEGDTLAVYGAPSLTRVRRLTIGVRGDDPGVTTVDGEIWVNEIRLREVKKDPGYAGRVSGSARLADLMTVNGNMRYVDSEFRRIEGDRHGKDEFSYSVRGDLKLNKFFDGRGISLPISGEYGYSESTPLLQPNSDIELEDPEDKEAARTTNLRRSVSTRISKTRPSQSGWLRYTVDNMSLSLSNSTDDSRSPFQVSRRLSTSGQGTYNLNPGQGRRFRVWRLFDFSYFPALKLGMNGGLNETFSADVQTDSLGNRFEVERAPVRTRNLEGTLGFQWDPIRSNSLDSQFQFNKRQDFDIHKELSMWESFKRGGRELRRDHNSRLSYRPNLVRWLRPVVSYDTRYEEDQGPGAQAPDVPDQRLRRVQNSSTREISASLNFRQLLGGKKGRAGREPSRRSRRSSSQGSSERTDSEGEGTGAAAGKGAGEEGEEEEASPGPALPSPGEILNALRRFALMFGDIRYSYTDRRSSRYSRVGRRPDVLYQLGLQNFNPDWLVQGTGANLIEDNTEAGYGSKVDASFQPVSSFFVDTHYVRSITRRVLNSTRTKTEDVTFPDFTVNIDGLERRGFLKKLSKSSGLSSSFRRQRQRSGRLPADGVPSPPEDEWYDNETIRSDFTPLFSWSTNWNSGVNTTIGMNRSKSTDESQFNNVVSRTETTNRSLQVNGRYSFSAPRGISLFGKRLRFQSDLTVSLDFDTSEEKVVEANIQASGETTTTVRSHQKRLNVRPRATYNFSRKMQGSLDLSYSRSKDLQRERTETTITVAIEAVIKF